MTVRLLWVAGPSGTTEYRLTKGSSASGSFSPLATVSHSLTGDVYDSASGLFYYDDMAGGSGSWYNVVASSGATDLALSYNFSTGLTTYPVRNIIPPEHSGSFDPPPPSPVVIGVNDGPPPPIGWAVTD